MIRNIFKKQIGAETCGVRVDLVRLKVRFHIFDHICKVHVALAQRQVLAGVVSVAGPIEGHDAEIFVLGNEFVRKFLTGLVVHVPAEAVSEDDCLIYVMHIAAI